MRLLNTKFRIFGLHFFPTRRGFLDNFTDGAVAPWLAHFPPATRRRRLRMLMLIMTSIFAEEDLAEGGAEVRVEDRVYDGVQQAVEVAQPADDAHQQWMKIAGFCTERLQEGNDEEWQPTDDEGPGYNCKSPGRLTLSGLGSLQSLRPGRCRGGRRCFRGAGELGQFELKTRQV